MVVSCTTDQELICDYIWFWRTLPSTENRERTSVTSKFWSCISPFFLRCKLEYVLIPLVLIFYGRSEPRNTVILVRILFLPICFPPRVHNRTMDVSHYAILMQLWKLEYALLLPYSKSGTSSSIISIIWEFVKNTELSFSQHLLSHSMHFLTYLQLILYNHKNLYCIRCSTG